jgi:ArsR family metal-binding transcriptional regulator
MLPPVPTDAARKGRPVNALLKSQILHLHEAERRLPLRHHTDIYINAIKTEGEAAEYIRAVTEAIHDAHAAAEARRATPAAKRKSGIDIAAVADDKAVHKPKGSGKKSSGKKKGTSWGSRGVQ